jgi:hypothetical protein
MWTSRIGLCTLSVVLAAVPVVGTTPPVREIPPHRAQEPADAAFERAKATGDLSEVKRELAKLYLDPSTEIQAAGLAWIGRHAKELTDEQQVELEALYLEVNSNGDLARDVRQSLALQRFERWPREEREKAYWEAVKNGKVVVEDYQTITRSNALELGSAEGMDSLKPAVLQYKQELDRVFRNTGVANSSYLLWSMELRAGAPSREAAVGIAVGRLGAFEDSQLAALMEEDTAFRQVVADTVDAACGEETTAACVELGRVAVRQEALCRERLRAQGKEPPPCYPGSRECDWVERLLEETRRGRERLRAVNQPQ